MSEQEEILKKQERLYTELTATFTDKKQFTLLNKLIDVEIEAEKKCNQ